MKLASAAAAFETMKEIAIGAVKAEHNFVVDDLRSQYEALQADGQRTQDELDATIAKAASDLKAAEEVRSSEAETAQAAAHGAARNIRNLQEALNQAKQEGHSSDATSASLQQQLEESQQLHR